MRELGHVQIAVLRHLAQAGSWSQGCGWVYQSPKRTKAVLDSLVRHGLVNVINGVYGPSHILCPWCSQGARDEWGECERCGYTGNCAECGATVEPRDMFANACSPQCRASLNAADQADMKA